MSDKICVYAVSDMTGETVARIVRAASTQFTHTDVEIKVLAHAHSASQVIDFVEAHLDTLVPCAVFHTILSPQMREDMRHALQTLHIPSIDLLGSTAHVISDLAGEAPTMTAALTIEDGSVPTYYDLAEPDWR